MRAAGCAALALSATLAGASGIGRAEAVAAAPVDVLLFIDDLHLAFRDTPRTRDLVQRLVERAMRPEDEWSVATTGTSGVSQARTRDKTLIESLVGRITGNRLWPADELGDLQRGIRTSESRRRAEMALSTAVDAVSDLTPRHGRTSAVLYFTSGYDLRGGPSLTALITMAQRTQVAIHVLDPRAIASGAPTAVRAAEWAAHVAVTRDSAWALASQTGGESVFDPFELGHVLAALGRAGP